jgi:hypothetical protein
VSLWVLLYRHIVEAHRHEGEWLFLHYDQMVSGDAIPRLETFLQAEVDRSFPDSSLRRVVKGLELPKETQTLYETLCRLAGY